MVRRGVAKVGNTAGPGQDAAEIRELLPRSSQLTPKLVALSPLLLVLAP